MWIFKRKKRKRKENYIWDKSMSVSQPNLLLSSSSSSSSSSVDLMDIVQQQKKEKESFLLLSPPPPLLLCAKSSSTTTGRSGEEEEVEEPAPPQEAAVAGLPLLQSPGLTLPRPPVAAADRPWSQSHHKSASLGSASLREPLEEEEEEVEVEVEALSSWVNRTKQVVTEVGKKTLLQQLSMGAPGTSGVSPDRSLPSSGMYKLDIELKKGLNLAIRDRGGTSDPYVKMKLNGKEVFRSKTVHKNLNPVWDERTSLVIDSLNEPLYLKVFDYDFGLQDDFMGSAYLNLVSLEQHRTVPVTLALRDAQHPADDLGTLDLLVTLSPKHSPVEESTHTMTMLLRRSWKRSSKQQQSSLRLSEFHQKAQLWRGIVSIALIEGRELLPMDANGLSDPYVKFRLGDQKYKSKTVPKTLSPQWREQFDLHLFEETGEVLEITVWDKDTGRRDDFIGRCELDLSTLAKEHTHHMELPLEDSRGTVVLLVTLTASSHVCIADLQVTPLDDPEERCEILQRYGVWRSLSRLKDVGMVQIKVMRAEGLMAADVNGKSDPFCVLELNNDRLQTHTVYKNLSPEWNKVFTFNVKDIHAVLEVSVYDEDRGPSADFLGKVAIPLLQMRAGGEKAYVLKNKNLTGPTKGLIYLETEVIYNTVKAALNTLGPAEQKYLEEEPKVSKQLLRQNFNRVKKCIMVLINNGTYLNSCFEWESAQRSITSFVLFVVVVWNFELYMLPLALVLLFTWNYLFTSCRDPGDLSVEVMFDWEDEDDDKDDKDSERKGLMDKLYAIQDVFISVQSALDDVASYGERIKNSVNWTVPFISWLAIISLGVATVLLYFIPLRYLVLAWGVNKFTKKLRDPYLIDTNELLNFFSRVPSDVQLMQYSELKVDPSSQSPSKRSRRPHISS